MKWLQLHGLTDKQQLTFLPGDRSSGQKPAFCFPGEYPADVLSMLTEIGFTPAFEGLTAPLTYEIADRLPVDGVYTEQTIANSCLRPFPKRS